MNITKETLQMAIEALKSDRQTKLRQCSEHADKPEVLAYIEKNTRAVTELQTVLAQLPPSKV